MSHMCVPPVAGMQVSRLRVVGDTKAVYFMLDQMALLRFKIKSVEIDVQAPGGIVMHPYRVRSATTAKRVLADLLASGVENVSVMIEIEQKILTDIDELLFKSFNMMFSKVCVVEI